MDDSGTTVFQDPWNGIDTLQGNVALEGTKYADNITGNSSDNLFIASDGDDYYDGNAGTDEIDYFDVGEHLKEGISATVELAGLDSGSVLISSEFTDTISEIERISATDYNDTLKGDLNPYNDTPINTSLEGFGGDDWFTDGYGHDSLVGGEGNDTFFLTGGIDSLYGDDGTDWLNASGLNFAINVDMENNSYDILSGGEGYISSIENVIGTEYNDSISINSINNNAPSVVFGEGGNDFLDGDAYSYYNNDTLYGGSGNDTLVGNGGNDSLLGEDGDDSLEGGIGNDYLSGNSGHDTLIGGTGADTFYFGSTNEGEDHITDFNIAEHDVIMLVQSESDETFHFNYAYCQYLETDDFERVVAADVTSYQGNAGNDTLPEMVLFVNAQAQVFELIYDPDGNGSDTGTIIAHFEGDPGLTQSDIYVEVLCDYVG
jgi:Ca2+-binding RTX toxin-like protein